MQKVSLLVKTIDFLQVNNKLAIILRNKQVKLECIKVLHTTMQHLLKKMSVFGYHLDTYCENIVCEAREQ